MLAHKQQSFNSYQKACCWKFTYSVHIVIPIDVEFAIFPREYPLFFLGLLRESLSHETLFLVSYCHVVSLFPPSVIESREVKRILREWNEPNSNSK